MNKTNTLFFLFLFLFVLLVSACKKDRMVDQKEAEQNNTGIRLEPDIIRLGNFFGNVFSDIVLIHAQSGPLTELKTANLKDLLKATDRAADYFVFNVHQIQTLHPEKFEAEISFEAAQDFNQESVAILAKVIRHFKNQDKKVYVLGISYGAYIAQELILQESPVLADKYLLMAGRLDMPKKIWQSFSEGNTGGFIDGTTPFTGMPSTLSAAEKNNNKLLAGLSYKRYTEALSIYDNLSSVTYCFGTKDEQMGALTQNEQDLLITRLAKILQIDANHNGVLEGLIDEGFEVGFSAE